MEVKHGVSGAINNTPLIRINTVSEATGCEILGKAEFMSVGGSVKVNGLNTHNFCNNFLHRIGQLCP